MIYKTMVIPLKASRSDLDWMSKCNKLSAQVWNLCLDISDKYRKDNGGGWIQRGDLQKLTKKCVFLHSKGIYHVVHKYLFARDAMLKSRNKGVKNVRYPHRRKRHFTTGWDIQSIKVDYEKGIIGLSKPESLVDGKIKREKQVQCFAKTLPQNIVEVELMYKGKYYLAIKYKEDVDKIEVDKNNVASIDLGEIHAITSIDNKQNAIIITGRKLRAIKQMRNRHQANIYRRMSKCKKDSKKYKIYKLALVSLKEKTDRKTLDAIHKTSKHYLNFCLENNISKVFYGDLDSATRNTKQNGFGGKKIRQKLSQWNYGLLMKQMENKLTRYDIVLKKVKEYYTSQTCPSCGERHKPKGRDYICVCGYRQHRDIVGAINILNDNIGSAITRYITKKYLQIT